MPEFLAEVARRTLLDLRGRFEDFDRRASHVLHGMVQAPLARRPDREDHTVTNESIDLRGGVVKYRDDGPPVRVHYYFDGEREEVSEFRELARDAGMCLAGWPGTILEQLGASVNAGGLRQYREPEYWMSVVHRFAWRAPQGSPLQAVPSIPDDNWQGDVEYPEGVEVVVPDWRAPRDRYHIEDSIPPDCIWSMISGFGVGRCSVYAIDIALAALEKVYPRPAGAVEPAVVLAPNAPVKKGGKRLTREEIDRKVGQYLKQCPGAACRDIAVAIGVSPGSVCESPAWKARPGGTKPVRRTRGRTPRTVPLSDGILANRPGEDLDPADLASERELAERRFIEQADPAERARINGLSQGDREAEIARLAADQSSDAASRGVRVVEP